MEPLVGTGVEGFAGDGSAGWRAQFSRPATLALDGQGRLYIADAGNSRIRRVETNGTVSTVAAEVSVADLTITRTGNLLAAAGSSVLTILPDGTASIFASGFENASALAAEASGTVLVADGTSILRVAADGSGTSPVATGLPGRVLDVVIMPDGTVVFAAAEGIFTLTSGTAVPLAQRIPTAVSTRLAVDSHGDLYVTGTHRVWKVAGGALWTLAGLDQPGSAGDGAPAVAALLNTPTGLAVDAAGNVFVADTANHRVRFLRAPPPPSVSAVSPAVGAPEVWPRNLILRWTPVFGINSWDVYFGTNPASLVKAGTTQEPQFNVGDLSEAATYYWRVSARILPQSPVNSQIFSFSTTALRRQAPVEPVSLEPRNFAAGMSSSVRFTWRGSGAARYDLYLDETPYTPKRVAMTQNMEARISGLKPSTQYFWRVAAVNEFGETRSEVREFTTAPRGGYPWLIETIAGTSLPIGDEIRAADAVLNTPTHVVAGPNNSSYFIESGRVVRRIDSEGKLQSAYSPQLGVLTGLAVDSQGNLFVAASDHVVRVPVRGAPSIVAGQPGRRGFAGDGGPAIQAQLDGVAGVAVDRRGFLYIADSANHRVRVVTANGRIRTLAGTGECTSAEPGLDATQT
ncbi:MAG TPA: hypothetical protein VES20_24350, partial [Bryobacteraceae bacterium]|nr:hypothetical protein [Bryobacteraceae bacterium]